MALLNEVEPGVSATTTESADGLISLNQMLDSWRNEKLMCYAIQEETIPLAATNNTRTVGPSGNVVSTRPVRIEDAYIIYSNISIPVRMIDFEEWDAIADKTSTSTYPNRAYYQPDFPDGKFFLYPVPNATSSLRIRTWTPVLAFAAVGTTISLPPGWEMALTYNLAISLAPKYKTEVTKEIQKNATESKANIKRVNATPIKSFTELGVLLGRHRSNILTGP